MDAQERIDRALAWYTVKGPWLTEDEKHILSILSEPKPLTDLERLANVFDRVAADMNRRPWSTSVEDMLREVAAEIRKEMA